MEIYGNMTMETKQLLPGTGKLPEDAEAPTAISAIHKSNYKEG